MSSKTLGNVRCIRKHHNTYQSRTILLGGCSTGYIVQRIIHNPQFPGHISRRVRSTTALAKDILSPDLTKEILHTPNQAARATAHPSAVSISSHQLDQLYLQFPTNCRSLEKKTVDLKMAHTSPRFLGQNQIRSGVKNHHSISAVCRKT
jgi:hypothetical protein